jgi:transcriptional regulator with XRE-family HTH domain
VAKSLFTRKHTQLRKLTQTDVADRLIRRQAYVSRIERGERRIDVVEFLDLAHAIGFNAARFIERFDSDS